LNIFHIFMSNFMIGNQEYNALGSFLKTGSNSAFYRRK